VSDIDAIRERHNYAGHFCAVNGRTLWVVPADLPCDTRVVLDALDNKTEIARAGIRLLDIEMDLHRATKADADRLAEGHYFTVASLAALLPCTHSVGDECGLSDERCLCCERDATAIIQAAKEAERE